ncbi:unnamed protein product [Clonostachys rosea f. rosea IK726]|jgi:MFS family permease|uniref:Major facilitator superfamily (MFS) profile domain-containing protein n=2 Tax=Bionectria ochroleuca TaxID=29856 RepID=A0A8H7KBC7_BIOOC|nr:unnamed protein product [Clonostachys rosea f. rosea IK726]
MPFAFILDDDKSSKVPGTVILDDNTSNLAAAVHNFKHGNGGVILVPQPSEDPNDPLNWSYGKKMASFIATLLGTCLYAGCTSPLLNAGMLVVAGDFNVSLTAVSMLAGEQMLAIAVSSPFVLALSRKYGKRLIYILSSLFSVIGTAICQSTDDFQVLRAGRIVQALGVTAYESLIMASVGDLFFVHQRGPYVATVNFMFAGVSNMVSVVSGSIVSSFGWRYQFHIFQACSVLQLLLQVFLSPETSYSRNAEQAITSLSGDQETPSDFHDKPAEFADTSVEHQECVTTQQPKTYWQSLALWGGIYSDDSLLQLWIATFAINLNIAVFYVALVQAFYSSLLVALAISIAQLFGLPPYNLSAAGIGHMSLGPFIGALVGLAFCGSLQDPLVRFLSRKNNGVYEPEFRLLLSPLSLATGAGLLGFGSLVGHQASHYACSALYGVALFGIIGCLSTTSSYVLDAFNDMSSELFVVGNCFKNFLFYGMSYVINDWITRSGPQSVFHILAGISFGIVVFMPVLYVFGKKYRRYWGDHNLLEKFHLRAGDRRRGV